MAVVIDEEFTAFDGGRSLPRLAASELNSDTNVGAQAFPALISFNV
jgi:hypothetical protein